MWLTVSLVIALVISTLGIVINIAYLMIDSYSTVLDNVLRTRLFTGTIRPHVKVFFDTHARISIVILLCYPLFVVSACILSIQRIAQNASTATHDQLLRMIAYAICMAPLGVVGWFVGAIAANVVLWWAPAILTAGAALGEMLIAPSDLLWLRPLIWGAALGSVWELAK
jgi:hypothetical protein